DLLPGSVELDALDVPGAGNLTLPQPADKEIPLPGGEDVPGVKRAAGHGDRRDPHDHRQLRALAHRVRRHGLALVVAAIADKGPSIVAPRLEDVDFVAAMRPLFGH